MKMRSTFAGAALLVVAASAKADGAFLELRAKLLSGAAVIETVPAAVCRRMEAALAAGIAVHGRAPDGTVHRVAEVQCVPVSRSV